MKTKKEKCRNGQAPRRNMVKTAQINRGSFPHVNEKQERNSIAHKQTGQGKNRKRTTHRHETCSTKEEGGRLKRGGGYAQGQKNAKKEASSGLWAPRNLTLTSKNP